METLHYHNQYDERTHAYDICVLTLAEEAQVDRHDIEVIKIAENDAITYSGWYVGIDFSRRRLGGLATENVTKNS